MDPACWVRFTSHLSEGGGRALRTPQVSHNARGGMSFRANGSIYPSACVTAAGAILGLLLSREKQGESIVGVKPRKGKKKPGEEGEGEKRPRRGS